MVKVLRGKPYNFGKDDSQYLRGKLQSAIFEFENRSVVHQHCGACAARRGDFSDYLIGAIARRLQRNGNVRP